MRPVSVVILNYNGASFLEQFLPSVMRHSENYEVVVADNASTDHSVRLISEKFPSVNIFQFDKNYGFSGGYNRAIQQIETPYTLLLNSDVEVTEGWVAPLVNVLEENPGVAAVQPKILSYHQKQSFEYAGAAGGFIDKYGYPFCRGRLFNTLEEDHGQYDDQAEIFWTTGACMLIRTHLYKEYGGFDEYFFAHMEEIDLCWRLQNAGFRMAYCPDSVVYHVGGGTLAKDSPRKVYLNFRNSLLVLVKNLPSPLLFQRVLIRLCLDFPAAVYYLLRGSFSCFWSVFKAHISFYLKLNYYLKSRQSAMSKIETMPGYFPKSILVKYYLSGIRKYTDL